MERFSLAARLVDCLAGPVALVGHRRGKRNRHWAAGFIGSADDDEVAHAPFDDLHFNGRHPVSFISAVAAVAMDQYAGVARSVLALVPGPPAALELDYP